MPIKELREHVKHNYAEHDSWCGYCWLESEACAGEPGGGGYDNLPSGYLQEQVHALGSSTTQEAIAERRRASGHQVYDLGRGFTHPADGTMSPAVGEHHHGLTRCTAIHGGGGEYAPEPAFDNPFALTGAIGGSFFHPDCTGAERFYRQHRLDILIGMRVNRPIDMIIITGIS